MERESERTTTVRESYAETVGCRQARHSCRITCAFARSPFADCGECYWQTSGSLGSVSEALVPGWYPRSVSHEGCEHAGDLDPILGSQRHHARVREGDGPQSVPSVTSRAPRGRGRSRAPRAVPVTPAMARLLWVRPIDGQVHITASH